jgi:glucosylceramidase
MAWAGMPCLLAGFLSVSTQARAQTPRAATAAKGGGKISEWLTDPGHSIFFKSVPVPSGFQNAEMNPPVMIRVDDTKSFQSIDGFGFALTGGSAQHIMRMSAGARSALLNDLFRTDGSHIGASYLRVSIGSSDLNDHTFSYDDMPQGQTDTGLAHFELGPDKLDVVPVLKQILAINPRVSILASPWSAPVWMKTNGSTIGGSLRRECYPVYARYLVRYIREMMKQGIAITAITVQNEPLYGGNNPSMVMPAAEEAEFIKTALGPAIRRAGLSTRIIVYDHNCDRPDYPIAILQDTAAARYVDGSAFHLYGGTIDAMSQVHDAFPKKNLYFTEQWVGAPGNFAKDIPEHVEKLIIGASRNWSKCVIEWNLAADPSWKPHTEGGCDKCLGAVTIDGDAVKRNPAYYIIAHAAKFVRPGSVRIASTLPAELPNVAFRTPAGKIVLIVLNTSASSPGYYQIYYKDRVATWDLAPGAIATFVWDR